MRHVATVGLALASLAVAAPAATAAGTLVEIDDAPGPVYGVDSGRVVFAQSKTAFAIKDRVTGTVTAIPLPADREVEDAVLTSHGALIVARATKTPFGSHLYELRDGAPLVELDKIDGGGSLKVAGDYAIWNVGTTLKRRDLTLPSTNPLATLTVATDAGNTEDDVAPNGDVAYWTTSYDVARWRSGVTTTLATHSDTLWHTYPRTDGTNVVWRATSPCCGAEHGELRAHGASGAIALTNTGRDYWPQEDVDYRTADGFIAFTRGEQGSKQVWLREPDGDEVKVADAANNALFSLGNSGQVLYAAVGFPSRLFLHRPGQDSVELAPPPPDPDVPAPILGTRSDGARFPASGRWYLGGLGALRRVLPAQAPEDGSLTKIGSATQGEDNSAHASFAFSAPSVTGAAFECKLDGGPYETCSSPRTYDGLGHGQHTFAVRSVDANQHHDPDPAVAAWTVESEPPNPTIASPSSGARLADRTPTLSGSAGTADEDSDTVTLKIFAAGDPINPTLVRTVPVKRSGGSWSATVDPPLPDGPYHAIAEQLDAAGNRGTSQPADFAFEVDATPPDARLTVANQRVLAHSPVLLDAGGSHDASSKIVRYEFDADGDGDFERDTGTTDHATATFSELGTVTPGVRVTDSLGNRSVDRVELTVAPPPPPGLLGITIDEGARFTNDPNVFVDPVWRPGDLDILLSNDGGFQDAVKRLLGRRVPWRLDSSGPERLPKTVYARFDANGAIYQDDIILDETPPALTAARITKVDPRVVAAAARKRIYHLELRASDRTAGVSRMQLTTNRKRPGRPRRFRTHVEFKSTTFNIFVRVRDRAGNWSHWKLCQH